MLIILKRHTFVSCLLCPTSCYQKKKKKKSIFGICCQEATEPVIFWREVTYSTLGAYLITATLANDVSISTAGTWVSVEEPITSVAVLSANISLLTSPAKITLDVNTDADGPDRVIFAVSFSCDKNQTN